MIITSLLENTIGRTDMKAEHGLSLWIETDHHRILFDMGQSDLFSQNAQTLGISLADADIAVLSHGHYDHGGGLGKFLELNSHAPVYIQRDAFLPHYNGTEKYIGLDTSLACSTRFIFTEDYCRIDDALSLCSCSGKQKRFPASSGGLTEKNGALFVRDDFRHEQYLMIHENGKDILISGCSHKGILNIMEWFSPDVLVGGFHFSKLPTNCHLADAAKQLAAYKTEFFTCHCTGQDQYEYMRQYMPNLHYLACGQRIEL